MKEGKPYTANEASLFLNEATAHHAKTIREEIDRYIPKPFELGHTMEMIPNIHNWGKVKVVGGYPHALVDIGHSWLSSQEEGPIAVFDFDNSKFGIPRQKLRVLNVFDYNFPTNILVGEYGIRYAECLLRASEDVKIGVAEVFDHSNGISKVPAEKAEQYSKAFSEFTFRANEKKVMMEGVQTIAGAASVLTAAKVKGFEDPIQLLSALNQNRVISKFARGLTLGEAARMFIFGGHAFPYRNLKASNGKLRLSDEWVKVFSIMHAAYKVRASADVLEAGETGKGCPAGPAIDIMSDLFLQRVKEYY